MSELGPCPLCGGKCEHKRENDHHGDCFSLGCKKPGCRLCNLYYTEEIGLEEEAIRTWDRLSAMAASERRMREALERCQRTLGFLHVCAANAGLLLPADEEKYQDVCAGIDEALSEGGKQR